MKTIMSFLNLPCLFFAGFLFAGCYTQLQSTNGEDAGTREGGNDSSYSEAADTASDTTNNNYFYDDGYRSSQYRMAFHYYAPSPYLWGGSIWYDPWYDDNWDPWYTTGLWYPTLVYPYPYWYPRYGHSHNFGGYYGGYYASGHYGQGGYRGGFSPGRRRDVGATRGNDGFSRGRAGMGGSGANPVASGSASGRSRSSMLPAAPAASQSRSRQEVPWWQRAKNSGQESPGRGRVTDATQSPRPGVSTAARPRNAGGAEARPSGNQQQGKSRYGRASSSGRHGSMRPEQHGRTQQPSGQGSRQASPRPSSPPSRSGGSGGNSGGRSGGGRSPRN